MVKGERLLYPANGAVVSLQGQRVGCEVIWKPTLRELFIAEVVGFGGRRGQDEWWIEMRASGRCAISEVWIPERQRFAMTHLDALGGDSLQVCPSHPVEEAFVIIAGGYASTRSASFEGGGASRLQGRGPSEPASICIPERIPSLRAPAG